MEVYGETPQMEGNPTCSHQLTRPNSAYLGDVLPKRGDATVVKHDRMSPPSHTKYHINFVLWVNKLAGVGPRNARSAL